MLMTYYRHLPLSVLRIALMFSLVTGTLAQHKISVAGIVVDGSGRPVRGAAVSIGNDYSKCPRCRDTTATGFLTGDNGFFFHEDTLGSKWGRLHIVVPPPEAYMAFYPRGLLRRYPEFRGIPVKKPKSGATVNLEYVKATTVYVPFTVDLLKTFEIEKARFDQLSSFNISIHYKDVTLRDRLMITPRYIDWDKGAAKLALPGGEWKLDLFATDMSQNGRILKRSVKVKLLESGVSIEY